MRHKDSGPPLRLATGRVLPFQSGQRGPARKNGARLTEQSAKPGGPAFWERRGQL